MTSRIKSYWAMSLALVTALAIGACGGSSNAGPLVTDAPATTSSVVTQPAAAVSSVATTSRPGLDTDFQNRSYSYHLTATKLGLVEYTADAEPGSKWVHAVGDITVTNTNDSFAPRVMGEVAIASKPCVDTRSSDLLNGTDRWCIVWSFGREESAQMGDGRMRVSEQQQSSSRTGLYFPEGHPLASGSGQFPVGMAVTDTPEQQFLYVLLVLDIATDERHAIDAIHLDGSEVTDSQVLADVDDGRFL